MENGSVTESKIIQGNHSRAHNTLCMLHFQVGDYFGELALITGDPRAASVQAKGDCKLAVLDRKSFKRLLGSVEALLKKRAQEYKRA